MSFVLRALAPADLPLLHAWLRRPHVARWWGAPSSMAELEQEYGPVMRGEASMRAFIACWDARPAGFIQVYVAMGAAEGWWEDETDPGCRGIDQFLGEPELLGRGLGNAMVRGFVDRLFEDAHVSKVQADPAPDNVRGIRCYERAGLVAQRQVLTPDGPALLMVRARPPPDAGRLFAG
jgi:RimJ/RimL family protein N-acetyltransferase